MTTQILETPSVAGDSANGQPIQEEAELTREEALREFERLVQQKRAAGVKVEPIRLPGAGNAWLAGAGMLKDNPLREEWQAALEEYRRMRDPDDYP